MSLMRTFYRLHGDPFAKGIPPEDLMVTPAFEELAQRLEYMRHCRGLMLLTGEPGSGKTAAVRAFASRLNPAAYKVFYVPLSTVTPLDFYMLLNLELGGEPSRRKSALFRNLQQAVQGYVENAKKVPVVIIDEGQFLPNSTLNELPIVLNFRMDSVDPLLAILIGHPHLEEKLQRPLFRNINQRVLLRFRLPALSERETASYIAHHLSRVGGRPEVFSEAAVEAVHKTSGGICRMVNSLCLAALRLGAQEQAETLTEEHVYQVSNEV
jgi:type II secretory pathway predicted ATPase ExeA